MLPILLFAAAAMAAAPAHDQTTPAIAFGGTNYLVGWADSTLGPCVGRFGLDETPLDGAGICLAPGKYASAPAIAYDGVNYLVAWTESLSLKVARISTDGTLLDPGGILLATSTLAYAPAIRSIGSHSLIAVGANGGVQAVLIDRSLGVLASRRTAEGMWLSSSPSIAWDGREWLVAFHESPPALAGHSHNQVRAIRFTSFLVPLDPIPLEIGSVAPESFAPRAVWDGRELAVFWNVFNYTDDEIHARHIHLDGTLGEDRLVATGALLVDAEWDGDRYALLVADGRWWPKYEYTLALRHVDVTLDLSGDRIQFARTILQYFPSSAVADLVLDGDRAMAAHQEAMGSALRVVVGAPVPEPPRTRRVRR